MLVSIVTPSFNQGQFLAEAIRSVAEQEYPKIEHLVLDGGSTDGSVEILRAFEGRLAFWRSSPDSGQAAAINEGIARARGDVLAWLNSDDMLLPGAVAAAVRFLQDTPTCDVVCGFRYELVEPQRRVLRSAFPEPTPFSVARVCTIAQETVFFRRRVVVECGYLDESFHHCLDWEYWNRAVSKGMRFRMLPRFQGVIRRHSQTKTARGREIRAREVARIYEKYLGRAIGEDEAKRELGLAWWLGYYMIRCAGRIGFLNQCTSARAFVRLSRWLCTRKGE
jgi:glycosyltransferase involved in cell wall biosynthesis